MARHVGLCLISKARGEAAQTSYHITNRQFTQLSQLSMLRRLKFNLLLSEKQANTIDA